MSASPLIPGHVAVPLNDWLHVQATVGCCTAVLTHLSALSVLTEHEQAAIRDALRRLEAIE